MPKIKRPLAPGTNAPPLTSAAPRATAGKGSREWANRAPAEEVDDILFMDFYLNGIDAVRRGVAFAMRDGETQIAIDLDEHLTRGLWLRLLCSALLGHFESDANACHECLDLADWVTLSWEETYEDESGERGPWITVYADEDFVGYERYEEFFEGWEGESLRWLIPELGITPAKLRSTMKRVMPEEG